MKTKLLKKLRSEAANRIGVFKQDDGKYKVIFDKTIFGDVSQYDPMYKGYQILETDIEDLTEAIESCDFYRRCFILREVRKKRFRNEDRLY